MSHEFLICIDNAGFEASLENRKLYRRLADSAGDGAGLVRVIDESGEDYLYPADRFVPVTLTDDAARAVIVAA
ncbi:MAG: hypothetical protein AB7Q81_07085 [Gammaproteobacteria bacterium]